MHYETIRTQMKVAQLLHEMDGCQPSPFEECSRRQDHVVKSAGFLGKLMPTIVMEIVPRVRKDERDKIGPQPEHGCTFDCSICHQDCQEWGCRQHEAAA